MTYEQAIDFWFSRINYEQRTPQPGDLKLDRCVPCSGPGQSARPAADHSRRRQQGQGFNVGHARVDPAPRRLLHRPVHLAASLPCRGTHSGRRQADHQVRTNRTAERCASEIARWSMARRAFGAAFGAPTFFEIATALGFLHFVRRRVQAAVVEVGLGGRFDSTNVCLPAVALITSISFDHTLQLGNSLGQYCDGKSGHRQACPSRNQRRHCPRSEACDRAHMPPSAAALQQLGVDFHYRYKPATIPETGAGDQEAKQFPSPHHRQHRHAPPAPHAPLTTHIAASPRS